MSQADAVSTNPLPPGVTEAALSRALDGFTAALGRRQGAHLRCRPARVPRPVPARHVGHEHRVGRVMPTTVEEIQEILRVANEHGVPLWTHGTGRNNGYGGPAPRVRGSVIVSLRNMNRVLEINEELGYAVVEPGVRWFDLYEAIKAGNHRLMLSIADLGWGGVDRQHARPRRHLHALRRRHGHAVRDGGRARQRRGHAHRAWARCPTTSPGTSTSVAWGRRPTSSSCSPTSGS